MTADRHRRLAACHLYLVATVPEAADPTDPPAFWWTAVEASVRGGAGAVQLRAKRASTDQRCRLVALARQRLGPEVLLIVNDDLDAARCADADGVHLGREDAEALPRRHPAEAQESLADVMYATSLAEDRDGPAEDPPWLAECVEAGVRGDGAPLAATTTRWLGLITARTVLGRGRLLGTSTREPLEVDLAISGRCDHVGFGAMAASGTKRDATLASPAVLRRCAQEAADFPIFPIGGLGPSTLCRVLDAGVRRAAVGSALLDAEDPWRVASELRQRLARAGPGTHGEREAGA